MNAVIAELVYLRQELRATIEVARRAEGNVAWIALHFPGRAPVSTAEAVVDRLILLQTDLNQRYLALRALGFTR